MIFLSGNAEVSLLKPIIYVKYYPELRINVNNYTSYILHVKVVHILKFVVCENNHVFNPCKCSCSKRSECSSVMIYVGHIMVKDSVRFSHLMHLQV